MKCDYGCGQQAIHQFKNGKWCCSLSVKSCPAIVKKSAKKRMGVKRNEEQKKLISQKTKIAMNKPEMIKKMKIINNNRDYEKNEISKRVKKYYKDNPKIRKKISEALFRRWKNKEYKENIIRSQKLAWKKRKALKADLKTTALTIDIIKERYPFFYKIENIRYNPENDKEIQVHCKNHNCPNSKEKGGWFTPTYIQLYERIRQLEKDYGNGGCYFYCCDDCKNECPLYNLKSDPYHQDDTKLYKTEEYKQFREFVLERDKYLCQYCGRNAEHVHHERPKKLEPFFSLDPDYAWSVCKECHYKYGHRDECSTGKLAKLICK